MKLKPSLVVVGAALLLGGCSGYRPLYGTAPDGTSVVAALSSVTVPEQRTRTGQLLRNELLSGLNSDGSNKFELRLAITENTGAVSSLPSTTLNRKRYNLSVHYELVALASGEKITAGNSFANVSFDTVREPVADLQAANNARDRATTEVGQDIRQRLAAFAATHK
jgi:LPS-assembly lipoprotein